MEATDSVGDHRSRATGHMVSCAVVTLSDSRGEADDRSGAYLREAVHAAGHRLAGYRLIRDEPDQLRAAIDALERLRAQVILCSGGTGIAPRDRTVDTLRDLWERQLPGFGELFRQLSFAEIGPAAMLSRADAGLLRHMVIFALPGSTPAVRLAWERLIAPELAHLVSLLPPAPTS